MRHKTARCPSSVFSLFLLTIFLLFSRLRLPSVPNLFCSHHSPSYCTVSNISTVLDDYHPVSSTAAVLSITIYGCGLWMPSEQLNFVSGFGPIIFLKHFPGNAMVDYTTRFALHAGSQNLCCQVEIEKTRHRIQVYFLRCIVSRFRWVQNQAST